jgi:hypothetical protein
MEDDYRRAFARAIDVTLLSTGRGEGLHFETREGEGHDAHLGSNL